MKNKIIIDDFEIEIYNFKDASLDLEIKKLDKYLTIEESSYINSIKDDNMKLLKLEGYTIPKISLSNSIGCRVKDIVIHREKYKKPFFEDYKEFFYSISYSFPYIVFVLYHKPIGIDIEMKVERDFKALRYVCSKDEIESSKSDEEKYKLWTFKEAYSKFKGTGIDSSLKEIHYSNTFFYESFTYKDLVISIVKER